MERYSSTSSGDTTPAVASDENAFLPQTSATSSGDVAETEKESLGRGDREAKKSESDTDEHSGDEDQDALDAYVNFSNTNFPDDFPDHLQFVPEPQTQTNA